MKLRIGKVKSLLFAFLLLAPLIGCNQGDTTKPDISNTEIDQLVKGNSSFAFDLFGELKGSGGNIFYSPYSLSAVLAMVYAGATGNVEEEMADVLHFDLSQERLHPAFKQLASELEQPGEAMHRDKNKEFQLNIANALWGREGVNFVKEFLNINKQNYNAEMRCLDFAGAPEKSRNTINGWVEKRTEGKIKDLIPADYTSRLKDVIICLTNAIYFKAAWLYPFIGYATHPAPFYLLDGSEVSVPMMKAEFTEFEPLVKYGEGDDYQAIELPYYGGDCSMVVILPREGEFLTFQDSLNAIKVDEIINSLAELSVDTMKFYMPKFKFESRYELKEVLAGMGMPAAFYGNDFASMVSGGGLFIDQVFHKAYISVDEIGTEAAAASAAALMGIIPNELIINRPFIFLIRDIETGAILFIGRVMNPNIS